LAPQIKSVRKDPPQTASILLYGPHKAGKTTFVATMPKPVFIVPQGRGTGSLRDVLESRGADEDIHYIPVADRAEMEEACIYVRDHHEEHGWETAALDPLSVYGRMVQMELEAAGYEGWDVWRNVQQDILNNWNLLMGAPIHVVFVLHVDPLKSGDLVLRYQPRLVGKTIDDIAASVDMIAFLEKTDVPEHGPDGKLTNRMTTRRALWTKCPSNRVAGSATPPFDAGCRWEKQLTEGCYKPDWKVLAKRLEGYVRT